MPGLAWPREFRAVVTLRSTGNHGFQSETSQLPRWTLRNFVSFRVAPILIFSHDSRWLRAISRYGISNVYLSGKWNFLYALDSSNNPRRVKWAIIKFSEKINKLKWHETLANASFRRRRRRGMNGQSPFQFLISVRPFRRSLYDLSGSMNMQLAAFRRSLLGTNHSRPDRAWLGFECYFVEEDSFFFLSFFLLSLRGVAAAASLSV